MKILGIKLTHDGGVSLLREGRLEFSVEMEKINNNQRHEGISDPELISEVLQVMGCDIREMDVIAIDGWDGADNATISLSSRGRPYDVGVGPYIETSRRGWLSTICGQILVGESPTRYESYPHASSHVAAGWCTSPFTEQCGRSFALIWDGGMYPRLYLVDAKQNSVTFVGILFYLIGHVYALAGRRFGPYKRDDIVWGADELGVAGKLMAYIAVGQSRWQIVRVFRERYLKDFESSDLRARSYRTTVKGCGTSVENSLGYVRDYLNGCALDLLDYSDEDILASFHVFLEELLIERLARLVRRTVGRKRFGLTISGGCALNIKWNSAIRESSLFDAVWVPPFPNDSGNALGAACCAMVSRLGLRSIDWDVFRGLPLRAPYKLPLGWSTRSCSATELANVLAMGHPVVFLSGRSELGPRALGHRSILADPRSKAMKTFLNEAKRREAFRPVAPICLEDRAQEIFAPGTPDPYMLFDHLTRDAWSERIPAVLHLDGSARLQTIKRDAQDAIARVLVAFEHSTGVPLLCNTSANYLGRGFFPDVPSAMEWGGVSHIWSEGVLYERCTEQGHARASARVFGSKHA